MNEVSDQIEQALKTCPEKIVFLLGAFGSGKTTELQRFFQKHPHLRPKIRSFIQINSLDNAFLHLTNYFSWLSFFSLIAGGSMYLFSVLPQLGALPLLLISSSVFTKTFGNLVYGIHEACSSLFCRKLIVIEDLERSSVKGEAQWAFLANLWKRNRSYIVTLGYDPENKKQRLLLMELSLKLDGVLIELLVRETALYEFMKTKDPSFPFRHREQDARDNKGWLSLFTFRELQLLHSQVHLRKETGLIPLKYIEVAFELLAEKLDLAKREITFVPNERTLKGFSPDKLSPEQVHYLTSFIESITEEITVL